MKFLCVECDEAMSLQETLGPDEGSLSVVFRCGSCGRRIAMLTNAMETQMVHSLGVKVGGRGAPAEPMESIRENLSGFVVGPDGVASPAGDGANPDASAAADPDGAAAADLGGAGAADPDGASAGSGCPFSGMVADQIDAASGPQWTPEAEARMEKIPSFIRAMVRKGIEDFARTDGVAQVDVPFIERVRDRVGM